MPIATVVNEQQSTDAFLWLITVTDPASGVVLHGVNNLEDVVSNGITYTAFPFTLTLPPEATEKPQNLKITASNVSQLLMVAVRKALSPPNIKLELVLSSTPDTVEKLLDFFTVVSVDYNASETHFTLAASNIFARKTCTATYNQAEFPGLFFAMGG